MSSTESIGEDTVPGEGGAERELAELRDAVLDDWLILTDQIGKGEQAFQQSLSWRVTRPLRLAGLFHRKSKELGVVGTMQFAAAELARRAGGAR